MSSIGSDKARVWARELPLGKCSAKAVMLAIANYVDEDGHCWPSASTLARDTDQTEGNVRRLLKWLEEIGVIVRLKRWRTERGTLSYEPNAGRQTSDEIHLCLKIDHDELRGRILAEKKPGDAEDDASEAESDVAADPPISLSKIDTLNSTAEPSSLGYGAQGAYAPVHTLEESLQESKNPPNPPTGGDRTEIDPVLEADIEAAAKTYPIPITAMTKFRSVFAALAPPTRKSVVLAISGYAAFLAECEKKRKPRAAKDAHRWVQSGDWQGYVVEGQKAAERAKRCDIREGTSQWRAWDVFYRCCGKSMGIPAYAVTGDRGSRVANVPQEFPPLVGDDPGEGNWLRFGEGSHEFAAWRRRLRELDGLGALPAVLTVPTQWPPAKHATTGPPETLTEEDVRALSKMA